MNKKWLYDEMAARKFKPKDMEPYDGNNGRVNRCVELFKHGKLRTGGKLLDVGGGIGDLGYAVRELGLFDETLVIDISQKNLNAAAAKGNDTYCGDIDQVGFPRSLAADETFDVVVALDFIEHIIDPEYFARQCYRVLKPSGEVFLNTPNIEYWEHMRSLVNYGVFPHTSGDTEVFHGGHLAFYTREDLCRIFRPAGFQDFETFRDEECYKQPTEWWINIRGPKTQEQYVETCERLGNPNLLFKCEKP